MFGRAAAGVGRPTSAWRGRSAIARAGAATVLATALLGVTACAPEPGEETASPRPTTSSPTTEAPTTEAPTTTTPTPTTTPDPFAAPITFPACADLISPEQARELSGQANFTLFEDDVAAMLTQQATDMIFGPATLTALEQADPLLRCSWGIPSSSASVTLLMGVLPAATRTEFRAALDASDFQQDTVGDVARYTLVTPGGIATVVQRNHFVGDLWVAEVGTASGEFGPPAIEVIRAAKTP